ncbi:STM3941 family protein [Allosalinactinospora lopnorensis]|uniref:STM3941 family protein n=1 Tax=Allosalinactinospora lopnorensis TaxID=1352348 RepID=UPI000623BCE6|nr:STM3941 family protein [Allosalinactinospora lopnorensis]
MAGAAGPFTVTHRFQMTWNGVWLFIACLVFSVAGIALIVRGEARGDALLGLVALLLFGGGGLLSAAPLLSRRPVLVLDGAGVRLVAPWPRPSSEDVFLPWEDVELIRAATQVVLRRGDPMLLHHLVFVPRGEAERPFHPPAPWEPPYSVRIRSTWDRAVEEIVAEARRHRPGLAFDDRRLPRARSA